MTPDSHDLTAAGEVRDLARRLRASTEMMASHALGLDMHSWSEHCNNCLAAANWLDASPAVAGAVVPAEDQAEQFIQAAIDSAPEPLHRLGEYLTRVLDEDEWATAEPMLLALSAAPAVPGGWRTERAAINMWRDDALTKAAEIVRRHFGEDGAACAGDIRQLMSCFTPPAPEQGETDAE